MNGKVARLVPMPLTDRERDTLHALADHGERLWRSVGEIAEARRADAHAERVRPDWMRYYADVGAEVGYTVRAVRQWVSVWRRIRREFTAGDVAGAIWCYAHWREFVAIASTQKRPLSTVVAEWEASADDYAGKRVPVDVVRASRAGSNGKPLTDAEAAARALARAEAALRAYLRAVKGGRHDGILMALEAVQAERQQTGGRP